MTNIASTEAPPRIGPATSGRALWRRWVVANAVGELIGLGLAGGLAGAAVATFEPARPALAAGFVVATGAVEGLVVGGAQWRVLRTALPVRAGPWVGATVVGALVAWAAGVTPMLLLDAPGGGGAEPATAVQLVLAALLGLVAGPLLGGPQALALRGIVPRAWRWVVANAAAWACALPLTFLAPNLLPEGTAPVVLGITFALGALVAGAVAGAVHGVTLVGFAHAHAAPSARAGVGTRDAADGAGVARAVRGAEPVAPTAAATRRRRP